MLGLCRTHTHTPKLRQLSPAHPQGERSITRFATLLMTAPFSTSDESLAAAAAAQAAAASAAAAAAASATTSAAAPAPVDTIPDDTDRIDIVSTKTNVMDDPIVGVDTASVVVPPADAHPSHSDIEHRKSHHVPAESDPTPVANGEPDSDSVSLHVVVAHHDPSVDDHRDASDERVVDAVPDIPVTVSHHHHQSALQESQHPLEAQVDHVAITAACAQETDSHHHITEILPSSAPPPLHPPPPVMQQLQPPVKKKRKTYSTEEERRKARILKNRRTAEESRQRRMKRLKELEEYAIRAAAREKELQEEIRITKEQMQQVNESLRTLVEEKNAEIAQRDAEIQRLHEKLATK